MTLIASDMIESELTDEAIQTSTARMSLLYVTGVGGQGREVDATLVAPPGIFSLMLCIEVAAQVFLEPKVQVTELAFPALVVVTSEHVVCQGDLCPIGCSTEGAAKLDVCGRVGRPHMLSQASWRGELVTANIAPVTPVHTCCSLDFVVSQTKWQPGCCRHGRGQLVYSSQVKVQMQGGHELVTHKAISQEGSVHPMYFVQVRPVFFWREKGTT